MRVKFLVQELNTVIATSFPEAMQECDTSRTNQDVLTVYVKSGRLREIGRQNSISQSGYSFYVCP